ncbi:tenascin-like [Chaetodon auriga]|uniref:tenascin-like n=1 Tax=Chaetodon auriga TaxID=39042 RepID=UPI004032DD98
MDYGLLFFVLTGVLLNVVSAQSREYYFVNKSVTWTEAQTFCRHVYTDLATIESPSDVAAVASTIELNYTGKAWIGLFDDLLNSWRWSLSYRSFYGDEGTGFRNWNDNEPNNLGGQEYCVELLGESPYFGKWNDSNCSLRRQSVCYNGTVNGTSSFVKVSKSLNWAEAQRFCRENYVDLASIRNQADNDIITNLTAGSIVWIGLHREKVWSDGSTSLFRHWADKQPNSGMEQCVTTALSDSGRWSDDNCSLSFPFICIQYYFRLIGQDETSITLRWKGLNDSISFILQYDDTEINITAPDGDGVVTHTVSSLTAATKYTFTLFSVYEDVRISARNITAVTAPPNADNFTSTGQNETSITLQWNEVNDNVSFILQYDDTEKNITAPDGDGGVTHTVSSLTAATKYTFTLFSVFEDVRSSGVNITAVTAPPNADNFTSTGQDETSITLQWDEVNDNVSFSLQYDDTEINITAPDGDGGVTHTVSSLTAATKYTFTLFSVFEDVRSSGVNITAVTAPPNPDNFTSTGQNETSITLQWDEVNDNVSFILQYDDTEINITAPDGDGGVTHTVSSLTAATKYTFTLFSVFEDVRSSGVNITAVTAPPNPDYFRSTGQNETSITLQWNEVKDNVSFILQYDDTEINITAPDGDGGVTHTVSSLTAATKYTFTLFSVFEDVRSSGVSITAVTAPPNPDNFTSTGQDETSITLQWNEVNDNVSFSLQYDDTEINITAPDGDGGVTHTVSSLTAGTKYTFTLFSVFEDVRSSGVNITAVTAPPNPDNFTSTGQNETSITLQWDEVNDNVSFILQYDDTEINITAPDGDGGVTHTVSSLTAATKYTFTLFSVFEDVRSSGVSITAVTAPPNKHSFRSTGQNETSITLQWNEVNDNVSFILQYDDTEINITAPDGDGGVTHTVSSLTAATKYTFTLFSVFEDVRSSGVSITAVTAPPNPDYFRSTGQNETSITLQWNEVNDNVSFILQYDDTEINITAPDGDGGVTHTVSSLTAATKYTFTLFSVFEDVRSSGVNITAVTAPPNPDNFTSTGQNETSITLQWNEVNDNVSFILQYDDTEINITAPDGDGGVTHTVSSLTAATKYTFTLFSVFEDVRSSGVNITAVTAPPNPDNFTSTGQNETSITLQWNEVNDNVSFILHSSKPRQLHINRTR